ncbi:MAG: hypothetical protein LBO21_07700, partial [Synergistaceae bacterium]|nr:hypothetical protein [Synergistaceae bacterium]
EILKIGDRVAILREGRKIAAIEAKEADWDEIVRLMMGREFPNKYPRRAARASGEALRMGGKDAGELGLRGGGDHGDRSPRPSKTGWADPRHLWF